MGVDGPSEKEQWAMIGRYGTIGIEMGLCVFFGHYLGGLVDSWFAVAPWGRHIGLLMGVVAAFKALWRVVRLVQRDQARDEGDGEA